MTAYEKELLALAVEACEERYMPLGVAGPATAEGGMWRVNAGLGTLKYAETTLADALTALLRDLGVEVPERPSAGLVSALETALFDLMENIPADEVLTFLRRRFGEDPALVLALLEGGES